tara:strand:+ start:354 stop:770 length:417 start_codon:yes stop_codon:yes gene_type:complete
LASNIKLFKEEDCNTLFEKFLQAAETERGLPEPIRAQKLTSWPDYRKTWQAYGWDKAKQPKIRPTPRQIDEYDRVLELSFIMPQEDRDLIWAVAHSAAYRERGPNWAMIARIRNVDYRTVKRQFIDAILSLYYKLKEL